MGPVGLGVANRGGAEVGECSEDFIIGGNFTRGRGQAEFTENVEVGAGQLRHGVGLALPEGQVESLCVRKG